MFLHTTLAWNLDPVLHIYWYASNTPPLKANNNQEHQISHPSSCWCFAASFLNFTYICFDKEFIRDRSKRFVYYTQLRVSPPEVQNHVRPFHASLYLCLMLYYLHWNCEVPRYHGLKFHFLLHAFRFLIVGNRG